MYTDVYCGFWDKPNASVDIKPCPDCMMPTKNPQLQSHQINYIPIFECLKSHQINDIPINLMLDISSSEALQNNDSSNYGPNMDQTTAQTTAPCAWGIARDQPTDGRRALVLFLGDATNRKF